MTTALVPSEAEVKVSQGSVETDSGHQVIVDCIAEIVVSRLVKQVGANAHLVEDELTEEASQIIRAGDLLLDDPLVRRKIADLTALINELVLDAVPRIRTAAEKRHIII